MIRPVSGPFVVHADPHLVEVVARGAGPAGAIGVELFNGEVSLDLDGADVNQLVAVRFPLEGSLSPVQRSFIEAFFGEAAGDVLNAVPGRRSMRGGARRRGVASNDFVEVDRRLTRLVVGVDTLNRSVSSPAVEALLALEVLAASKETGVPLGPAFRTYCAQALEHLPRTFPVPGLEDAYREILSRAVVAGVLNGPPKTVVQQDPEVLRASSIPLGAFASYSRSVAAPAGPGEASSTGVLTRITSDPLSLLRDDVAWFWVGAATLHVTAPAGVGDEVLWVRLRSADGTILAASPLLGQVPTRREARLLVVPRGGLVLDIVPEISARVLDDRVAAIARAAECGQRAGRLERLGELDDAAIAWEECAAWHRIVGDSPREKLAMLRSTTPTDAAPTLLDSLLENRSPMSRP